MRRSVLNGVQEKPERENVVVLGMWAKEEREESWIWKPRFDTLTATSLLTSTLLPHSTHLSLKFSPKSSSLFGSFLNLKFPDGFWSDGGHPESEGSSDSEDQEGIHRSGIRVRQRWYQGSGFGSETERRWVRDRDHLFWTSVSKVCSSSLILDFYEQKNWIDFCFLAKTAGEGKENRILHNFVLPFNFNLSFPKFEKRWSLFGDRYARF